MASRRLHRRVDEGVARRLPGVGTLARLLGDVARVRAGPVPVGLMLLLPVALALDAFDAADELFLGPVGIALSFVAESAFLLAVTGRAAPAFGMAALDLVPGVDLLPFCTISLVLAIAREWGRGGAAAPRGAVIDV